MLCFRAMNAKGVTPILNVSDMAASFAWFAKRGWRKLWDWGTPPTFGAVGSGEVDTEKRKTGPFRQDRNLRSRSPPAAGKLGMTILGARGHGRRSGDVAASVAEMGSSSAAPLQGSMLGPF